MKNRWISRTLPENALLLRKIGAKAGTYDIKWDVPEKVIRIKNSSQEWQIPVGSAIDAMTLLNNDNKFDRSYGGLLNSKAIGRIPDGMEGLYYIHSSDFQQVYIGKSDRCVKGRLQSHLRSSSNSNLRNVINSGTELLFYCWESPDPKYEESIEIKRLKDAGHLKGQRSEKKPLIQYLDD
jgi:hypothetical protein